MYDEFEEDLPPIPHTEKDDPELELKKLRYQTQLQIVQAQYAAYFEHDRALRESDYPLNLALNNAYLDVAKGQIDRAQARAMYIERAASTIGGAYAVVLGLSYSITKEVNRPLPLEGLAPTIFLGLSIVLAMIYLAYITHPKPLVIPSTIVQPEDRMNEERNTFTQWTTDIVLNRVQWLQSAVISLAFGVLLLPVAFLSIPANIAWALVAFGLVMTFLLPNLLVLLKGMRLLFHHIRSLSRWPYNAEEAANLFGGTPERWELSTDASKWKLKPGDPIAVNTNGLLGGGYNGDPISECYAWVGTQTVRVASIYRDSYTSDASGVADSLTNDADLNPTHLHCTIRI